MLVVFVTLAVGLSGSYTARSKAICITLAYETAFLMSVVRILLVCLMAFFLGPRPAVLFHDWGGTIFTLVWILLFWLLSFKKILVRKPWSPTDSKSPVGFETDEEMEI